MSDTGTHCGVEGAHVAGELETIERHLLDRADVGFDVDEERGQELATKGALGWRGRSLG